jgi:RimJ/RimL family protein N-acetyltransferase
MATNFRDAAPGAGIQDDVAYADSCAAGNWQRELPLLRGEVVTLRELRQADAPALLEMVSTERVTRFLAPPPADAAAAEQFIEWTHLQRAAGSYACFAVVRNPEDRAIGLFQVRRLDPAFATAEWGFVVHSAFWGTGVFTEAAMLMLRFAFGVCGVRRLEARVAAANGRGNGALHKMGAVKEGTGRRAVAEGRYVDEVVWTLTAAKGGRSRLLSGPRVH